MLFLSLQRRNFHNRNLLPGSVQFFQLEKDSGLSLYLELTQGKHVLCHTNRYVNVCDEENTHVCNREVMLA